MKLLHSIIALTLCFSLAGYKAQADVPSSGFKSLFIGHSFFRPFAEGMPDYVAAAGIAGHTQTVVFNGGSNGAPEALWNNASKRDQIQGVLDQGDVDLFVLGARFDAFRGLHQVNGIKEITAGIL